MTGFEFKTPLAFLLLIPYAWVFYIVYFRRRRKGSASIRISSKKLLHGRKGIRAKTYPLLNVMRFLSLFVLIFALAGPGKGLDYSSVKNRGIDIMVALDLSASMRGEDFQPKNRLTVAKQVVADFIDKRKSDRIGLVVFAGEAYLQCPLTIEHDMIKEIVNDLDFETVRVDGTAIGDALALSASRMMDSKAKSRVILLITDGMSNRGTIDPETAAKTCSEIGVKVYSVGIGKNGKVALSGTGNGFMGKRYLVNHFDETTLKEVSKVTSGKFYRAQSTGVFWEKVRDIDRLEKSEVDLKVYHDFKEKSEIFIIIGLALFLMEIILRTAVFRKVP